MRAVILAGGRGTRLRPYTTVIPKPLVPIGDRPILEVILQQLADSGFHRFDLCVGHLGNLIRAYLESSATVPPGVEIDYHWEEAALGTAGALRLVPDLDDTFLTMNGDILSDLDFGPLLAYHADQEAVLTIATHRRKVEVELGVLETTEGMVHRYSEKPTLEYDASMGIYVYEPAALSHIPSGRFDFLDLVHALLDAGERVAAYPFDGTWFDIGTASDHDRATEEFERDPERF